MLPADHLRREVDLKTVRMASRGTDREVMGRLNVRKQRASEPPVQDFVSVAVLPPRLPAGMAPPSEIGPVGLFSWDERLNWRHNEPISSSKDLVQERNFLQRAGLTTQRCSRNDSLPPYRFKQVSYDEWRKHYAKDADGNYHGTLAPAEDCLLKPADVAKWRFEAGEVAADSWTRGQEALPVYDTSESAQLPSYEADVTHAGDTASPLSESGSEVQHRSAIERPIIEPGERQAGQPTAVEATNESWKVRMQRGLEYAMMNHS